MTNPAQWSFRTQLVAAMCSLVLATGLAITWFAHRSSQAATESLADALFREVSGHAVTEARGHVLEAAPLVESLRRLADQGLALDDSDRLAGQLLAFLEANPGLSWVSYGDEAGAFTGVYRPVDAATKGGLRINQSRIEEGKTRLVEHDVLPDGSRKLFKRDDDSGYDPRTRPFYTKAKEAGRLVWLPPYVFYSQGVPGISCAAPVYEGSEMNPAGPTGMNSGLRPRGKLRGVVSVDFDLNALSEFVRRLSLSEHARVFLFAADGALLAHQGQAVAAVEGKRGAGELPTLADSGDPLVEAYRQHLRPEHTWAAEGDAYHPFEFTHAGEEHFASATAFRVGDDLTWVVGAVAPKSDFLADVWRNQAWTLAAAGGALLVAVALAFALAGLVSGPVVALIGFMRRVGQGDLEARAEFGGSAEFQELSEALNRMIDDLRDRLRLRHSLNVAMEVQQRLLPAGPPRVRGLDVAGHSTYCDETGGDYYDFLVLDQASPDELLVALGDVMGHGIAAALVMAGARAVLRDRADAEGKLAEMMGRLNRLIAADHGAQRFMTMHLSLLNSRTGAFRWVSAGHDPALIYDPAADRFEEDESGEMPLGIMEDTEFCEHSLGPLRPGQVITIGTDGVWEMPNEAEAMFGKERLRAVIREHAGRSAAEISAALLERLAAFRGQATAADDVTFVIIKVVAQ